MIVDGDNVLVALSGGPDSFLMLKLLAVRLQRLRITYRLSAAKVRVHGLCGTERLPERFVQEVEGLGIPLVEREIVDDAPPVGSPCFRCTWLRRKALFEVARDMGATKIALGHHADDLAETAIMNLFWHGRFATMPPVLPMMSGRFTLVRPMIFVSKSSIERWRRADSRSFLVSSCRPDGTRSYVRQLLKNVYAQNKAARKNLVRCVLNAPRSLGHLQ
jgi:tRNA 2-thiocytidine biosynthesis protein TtcA